MSDVLVRKMTAERLDKFQMPGGFDYREGHVEWAGGDWREKRIDEYQSSQTKHSQTLGNKQMRIWLNCGFMKYYYKCIDIKYYYSNYAGMHQT
jgi:hypothetical protein